MNRSIMSGFASLYPPYWLSFSQKLDLMETLWADLAMDEKKLESPVWHGAVLKEREAAYASGQLATSDWEQAKKRIKNRVFV